MDARLVLVAKPTAREQRKADVFEILRARLAEAERGEVDEIVVISRRLDRTWRHDESDSELFVETVGRLEILKADMIARYLVTSDRST